MDRKRALGQFFTKNELWLKPQIIDFIVASECKIAYDPFAGNGDLLAAVKKHCRLQETHGLDIDKRLRWQVNDSLVYIPTIDNALIITNPPYISNYSAARKGLGEDVLKYFKHTDYTDLYLLALDRMLAAQQNVVTIIPETFINSKYQQKDLLSSITILEENPFDDTETPVIVACFDGKKKTTRQIKLYKNDQFIDSLDNIERLRLKPRGSIKVNFNDPNGWLAVRCIDTTNPSDMIRFDFKENIQYDWEHRIKISSRLLTLIDLDLPVQDRAIFIQECNRLLAKIRLDTSDIILSPFKGNMKDGRRRRRLDFMTCRAIIEKSYDVIYQNQNPLYNNISSKVISERNLHASQPALL